MTERTLSRRRFITTALTAAGGLRSVSGIDGPAEAASLGVRPWGDDANAIGRDQRLGRDRADDTVIIRYGRARWGRAASPPAADSR